MKKILLIAFVLITSTSLFAQGKYTANRTEKEPYATGLFRSINGTTFDLENEYANTSVNSHLNILSWLQGRVAGLQVYNYYGTLIPIIRNYPATIYVDEIRTDASFLNMLPVADIALVKIMKMPNVLSGRGGAIAIYTKRGEAEEEESEETGK